MTALDVSLVTDPQVQLPLVLRVTWSPSLAALQLAELSLSGMALCAGLERHGGRVELLLPERRLLPQRPLLRWELAAGPVEEVRIEVRDAAGRWHLLGELLGGGELHRVWRGERQLPGGLITARDAALRN